MARCRSSSRNRNRGYDLRSHEGVSAANDKDQQD